jgi:hypothetical protein
MVLSCVALVACAGVLGIRPTNKSHPFEHRAHILKAGINCRECHVGIQTAGDEGPTHFPSTETCSKAGCHEKPHDTNRCDNCHGESHTRGAVERARETLRFEHAKHVPKLKGECVICHVGAGEERPDHLRPAMAVCLGCHQHQDQWRARNCNGCHVDLVNEGTPPTSHLIHEGDWIREHGVRAASSRDLCATCHAEKQCAGCHGAGTVPALPSRMNFDEPKLAGLHRAGFRSRHADEARAQPGLCVTCHAENTCQECHRARNVAPGTASRSPHPPGWLSPARGGGEHGTAARTDPVACAACHGGAGEQLSVGCHRVGGPGGNPHGPNFRGTADRRDKMRDVPCVQCHAP